MPNQKIDTQRWQVRKGATDARLALLLATVEQRVEPVWDAYFARLKVLLGIDDYARLLQTWQAEQDTPADLIARMEADPEACRLYGEAARTAWALDATKHNGIISEHYVYHQTGGKTRGPNGEK